MLEGIVSDILVRVLGSYVDGLNKESIRVGVWRGHLELENLRLRPDALAVLFESLGLDLPVTVTSGYIGLLRLEVPWKSLRTAPVRIFMHEVNIVASPVSDGDQSALEQRDLRLKAARLATDEALREAKFSVRSLSRSASSASEKTNAVAASAESAYGVNRWGWQFTSRIVTKIVDNIQLEVENVVVQYEDSSSVRDRPYTAMLSFDSLRACSTDRDWKPVFIESPTSPVVHKVVYMHGLVLNWEPGNPNKNLKEWIINSASCNEEKGKWATFVKNCTRHAIRPMDGELRIALTKSSALASAMASDDPGLKELNAIPRVQMDLHFPNVQIALDDFQYHTLLSTIMYLSDIDRKVRPKTALGRWYWALDRLLPRFKERREAALRFNVHGMREWRKIREDYCYARNMVVNARRKGVVPSHSETETVQRLEKEFSYKDIVLFRDIADRELYEALKSGTPGTASTSRFWSLFSRGMPSENRRDKQLGASRSEAVQQYESTQLEDAPAIVIDAGAKSATLLHQNQDIRTDTISSVKDPGGTETSFDDSFSEAEETNADLAVPNFKMGFLLGRGAIELREGGHEEPPIPVSSLEFRELRLGIVTRPGAGLLLEALLGTFEVVDMRKGMKVMYPRAVWSGPGAETEHSTESGMPDFSLDPDNVKYGESDGNRALAHQNSGGGSDTFSPLTSVSRGSGKYNATLDSYPYAINEAISDIRGEYGIEGDLQVCSNTHISSTVLSPESLGSASSSSSFSDASDGAVSGESLDSKKDWSMGRQSPLKYIAALRLNQEEASEEGWGGGATRMAMDLAIGGMEVLVDGPRGAFISSVTFWHPREKMPSIMQFLTRAAAPRLASLRMDIQKAMLERSIPMRMDILIRGPRFVIPGTADSNVSMVLDLGTFAMETSTGPSNLFVPDVQEGSSQYFRDSEPAAINVRYTDYKMACSDLGLYVMLEEGRRTAERIIKPFSVHLLLQVLQNSAFTEAISLPHGKLEIPKVRLEGELPSLRTSVSHLAFRQLLDIVKAWGERSQQFHGSGIEPNRANHSVSVAVELEEMRHSREQEHSSRTCESLSLSQSPLISFEMALGFEDLQLELRDASGQRIVTISTTGTLMKMRTRPDVVDIDYRIRTFAVVDGCRGATAPFRRLAYAGVDKALAQGQHAEDEIEDQFRVSDDRAFVALSYRGDIVMQEQSLAVKILSLNLVCVRETYFALADFFYLERPRKHPERNGESRREKPGLESIPLFTNSDQDQETAFEVHGKDSYSDPFVALGMTTSGAARALREQAERGMELSKQALANRGSLSVTAGLDGLKVTLVTAEGSIACFDVTGCKSELMYFSNGAIEASGELGGFGVRDLTSAFDVYAETVRYSRSLCKCPNGGDGWSLKVPKDENADILLQAHLKGIRIVYLHRFIVILKKYFNVLQESLKPVLEMKGGLGEVFVEENLEDFMVIPHARSRLNLMVVTENVDVVMPRHSQSPYEALRFFVPKSSISNADLPAPGYSIGFQVQAEGVNAHVLYQPPADGEGRAMTKGGKDPILQQITPNCPITDLTPFAENICLVAKLDTWRRGRVPEVILNADGIPVLKDGQEEREYDPSKWLPAIRVRISAPNGISARLCEAEYSILYFTFTENIIERPDIEFTDIVRGLKTPVLPARRPVQPIMFSSNRMPSNYQIRFEVPVVKSTIMSGGDPNAFSNQLIRTELQDLVGAFDYGVDFRMTIEVSANLQYLEDARMLAKSYGMKLVTPITGPDIHSQGVTIPNRRGTKSLESEGSRSITFTWDRPFGFRANAMVVASDLRVVIEPELFRDLGALTTPGLPFLKSSAPAPLLRFNGRLLILTISRPEIWLMANQFLGDGRSLVIRGDVIAKIQWAPVTGRNVVEVAASGIRMNLSNTGPFKTSPISPLASPTTSSSPRLRTPVFSGDKDETETPMLYPCDVSMKFEGRGYDPPEDPNGEPVKAPGSNLSINAESLLVRVDVNDTPLILTVGSRLVRLTSSELSNRPAQPGRFDQWIDNGEDGDAKLALTFSLPHCRLMFTDETAGRYIPIMEARIRNSVVRSNVPWLTNASFDFALELFNDEKGWWEPGIESFRFEIAVSKGRSGSQAIHIRADRNIDVNVTPNTVSGAARVSKSLKFAIEGLVSRLRMEKMKGHISEVSQTGIGFQVATNGISSLEARRPSVAAFCVRNETGRTASMWLPYDSTRRSLRGNGGEIEVDTPSDELLWTAADSAEGILGNMDNNRTISMSCVICLSGYEPMTLSTEQTGNRLVTVSPDARELNSPAAGRSPPRLSLVWAVTMRDGVPCGCIRSLLRLVNNTKVLLEISIGGLAKSASTGDVVALSTGAPSVPEQQPYGSVKAGEAWSIPVHAVNRSIRIRPAILQAPEAELSSEEDQSDFLPKRSPVYYTYEWSDPLSKVSTLYDTGHELHCKNRSRKGSGEFKGLSSPILTCRSEGRRRVFCISLLPKVDVTYTKLPVVTRNHFGWVDVHMHAPVVLDNRLPRPVLFKLATPGASRRVGPEHIIEDGRIEPLREAHIHGIGSDLSSLALAMGLDNSPQFEIPRDQKTQFLYTSQVGDYQLSLPNLLSAPSSPGRLSSFKLKLEHEQSISTRKVIIYCDYWIRNRSDTDLFFRDKASGGSDKKGYPSPKVFLRGCPPGTVADNFICFSRPMLTFQRADITEDKWIAVTTEVSEIDKPYHLNFEGISLLLDVRPARGKFKRTLIITVRNTVWLENRTGSLLQWCQPAALNAHGIALSSKVHSVDPGVCTALHWDFRRQQKALCFRRANEDGSSDWIWSRPVSVDGVQGEFAAKMYRPKRHEQYIARIVMSKLGNGVSAVTVHKEDRNTPPYRIVNNCTDRSIAFRQSGVRETHPWLVRPGRSSRYSWDDPQAPVKRRSLIVEVIENMSSSLVGSLPHTATRRLKSTEKEDHTDSETLVGKHEGKTLREFRYPKFDLNIDMIRGDVPFSQAKLFRPQLLVSVHVDGPTKVVTFADRSDETSALGCDSTSGEGTVFNSSNEVPLHSKNASAHPSAPNLDVELFIKSLGISFVESAPTELAYLSVTGLHFRLDRFDGQQLVVCEIQDMQLDNQLAQCTWPVVLWSPPPSEPSSNQRASSSSETRQSVRKPIMQFTVDGPFPSTNQGIGTFRGIFVAIQQLQLAADEDFVLRVWLFAVSLIDAAGGRNETEEALNGKDGLDGGLTFLSKENQFGDEQTSSEKSAESRILLSRLYVEHLELCPLKLSISFTSSRTSRAAEHIGGFRYLIRTLVAVLGNVENAEFRFNALELHHVFDTTSHFRSLIREYYVSQGSNQKMVLLASNSLIGNPSALFDSIAIGTRDFFVEPASAKGSADFIAGIGRGSSSLLTNTFGGIVGSLGCIPRAVAQGLETAVGDREYLAERDSIRGGRARIVSSPAQGLFTGALSFGHGIASGAAGLIRDPIQGAAEEGASGFLKGLGKGFVGGVLKPITGVLDLIAEPAAGFRSMMVSERLDVAEPARPPRAFWGPLGDRMMAYDLRAALGQAILALVIRGESEHVDEKLRSWTHLVAVHSNASDDDVISFLWALMRRSSRASFQAKYLLDAQGMPQKAEKMRVALITDKRIIVSSLDGHVLWEHPLVDIIDMQVSLESRAYLIVGVCPAGCSSSSGLAKSWKRVHCGSVRARDELHRSLSKAVHDFRLKSESVFQQTSSELHFDDTSSAVLQFRKHRREGSVEMVDMSSLSESLDVGKNETEMRSVHRDASVDGRRGVFTEMKLPGRGGESHDHRILDTKSMLIQRQLSILLTAPGDFPKEVVRSIRILLVNETQEKLHLSDVILQSGRWLLPPSDVVEKESVAVIKVDGSSDRVVDICGSFVLEIGCARRGDMLAIRFLNPLLASNAFAASCPDGYSVSCRGGEKGDHVTVVITLRRLASRDSKEGSLFRKKNRTSAEPLLYGRSEVSPYLPPITFSPPHAPKPERPDPNNPEIVSSLSSLGFSGEDARAALKEHDADVSKAYSALMERKEVI